MQDLGPIRDSNIAATLERPLEGTRPQEASAVLPLLGAQAGYCECLGWRSLNGTPRS